jgi:outer membrane lipoprotein-sorting protein
MTLRFKPGWLVAFLILHGVLAAQNDDLLTRIWAGVQQAQKKFTTGCGTITETRTSPLMVKPMVLHGKFCAQGTTLFTLQYLEPNPIQIRFNGDYLNVKTDGDKTEILEVGSGVRRAQSSFSRENSIEKLKKDFTITVNEESRDFEMKLVPRTDIFRRRLHYMVVKLSKRDFLPRSLEVDGTSGVNSVFAIDVTSTNTKLSPDMFEVMKPK